MGWVFKHLNGTEGTHMGFSQIFSGIAELDSLVFDQFLDYLGELTAKTQKTFVNSDTEPSQAALQTAYKEALGRNVSAPNNVLAFWFNPTDQQIQKVYKNTEDSLGFRTVGLDLSDPSCGIIEHFTPDTGVLGVGTNIAVDFSGWDYVMFNFRLRLANAIATGASFIRWNNDATTSYYYNQKYHRADGTVVNGIVRGTTGAYITNNLAGTVIPGTVSNPAYRYIGSGFMTNLNNSSSMAAWFMNNQFLTNAGEVTNAVLTRWASNFVYQAHIRTTLITTRSIATTANTGFFYGSTWTMIGLK